jgi:hypothetical protein
VLQTLTGLIHAFSSITSTQHVRTHTRWQTNLLRRDILPVRITVHGAVALLTESHRVRSTGSSGESTATKSALATSAHREEQAVIAACWCALKTSRD